LIRYKTYFLVDENDIQDNGEVIDEETPTKVRIDLKSISFY
jgi:hypothetical protein